MVQIRTSVSRRIYKGQNVELGYLARDLDDAMAQVTATLVVKVTDVYTEPFSVTFDHEPEGVLALRCREDAAPETEVAVMATVPFVYRNGKIEMTSVEGCTVGTKYRFTFWMVG